MVDVWVSTGNTVGTTTSDDLVDITPFNGAANSMAELTTEAIQRIRDQARREARAREQLRTEQLTLERDRRQEAERQAEALLPKVLSPEQLAEYQTKQQVTVQAPSGRRYVVMMTDYVHGNIWEVDEHGCPLVSMCVAPQMRDGQRRPLPCMAGWIGQILALRFDEKLLLAKANPGVRRLCKEDPNYGLRTGNCPCGCDAGYPTYPPAPVAFET